MPYGNYGGYGGARPKPPSGNVYDRAINQRQQSYAMGNRNMAAPQGYGAQPMAAPAMGAPAPTPGRMPTPNYAPNTQGMAPGGAQQPRGVGFIRDMQRPGAGTPQGTLAAQMAGLPPEYQKMHNDYISSLYAGGDFEGRHEMAQMLSGQYAQVLARMAGQPKVDFSGSSQVADQFGNQREQMQNALAARGISGSGVEAGALANSYGQQGKAMGQFYRDALEKRRQEELAQQMQFQNHAWDWQGRGLGKNWEEQADPGFWGDVAGIAGGVIGSAIPGVGGAIGKAVGGMFGGNAQAPGQMQQYGNYGYGNPSMYGPQQYPPMDWNDPYARGGS